jgi:hypothetical protein
MAIDTAAVLRDLTIWLCDPRVARLELYNDAGLISARFIVHADTGPYTRLAVGAQGASTDAAGALAAVMWFVEGGVGYEVEVTPCQ